MTKVNKENWEYKKLGEICESIFSGGTPSRSIFSYWNGNIPWAKICDLRFMYLDKCEEFISKEGLANSSAKIFTKGTILYSIFATIGSSSILNIDASCNQAIACIKLKSGLNTQFYFYVLKHLKSHFESISKGVAQKNINLSILKNQVVPVPPIEEQNRISSQFEEIDNLITLKQEQLKEFDALEQSVFYKMFQNDEKILTKKLVDIAEVGSSRRVFASEFVSEGVPFYRGTEISMLSIGQKFRPTLYITSQRYEELIKVKGKPVIGDLLLPSICNDGKIWVVNTDNPFYIKDGRVLWIHPKDKAITDSFYLKYVIKFYLINNFHKLASGTTFAEMKIFNLKKIPVPLPSLSLQKSFAQKIETIEKQKTVVQDEITQLQALLDSEMDKYFG